MGCEGDQEMESLSCKMRLRKCDMFGLMKQKPREDMICLFIFLSVLGKGREGIMEEEELFKLRDIV